MRHGPCSARVGTPPSSLSDRENSAHSRMRARIEGKTVDRQEVPWLRRIVRSGTVAANSGKTVALATCADCPSLAKRRAMRSEEHTSELQSLMRISYAVFCLKKKRPTNTKTSNTSYNKTQ